MLVGEEGDTDHDEKAAIYRGDLQENQSVKKKMMSRQIM